MEKRFGSRVALHAGERGLLAVREESARDRFEIGHRSNALDVDAHAIDWRDCVERHIVRVRRIEEQRRPSGRALEARFPMLVVRKRQALGRLAEILAEDFAQHASSDDESASIAVESKSTGALALVRGKHRRAGGDLLGCSLERARPDVNVRSAERRSRRHTAGDY